VYQCALAMDRSLDGATVSKELPLRYANNLAQCARIPTTFSRYRTRGKVYFVWTYNPSDGKIYTTRVLKLHCIGPVSDSILIQGGANVLARSVREADQLFALGIGRTHLKTTTIATRTASRVCPGVVVLIQCRDHVPLKPLDEVQERHVTLLDTADELVDTVPVDGRF